jgi:hypothetical protein
MMMYEEVEVGLHPFLTLAVGGKESSQFHALVTLTPARRNELAVPIR